MLDPFVSFELAMRALASILALVAGLTSLVASQSITSYIGTEQPIAKAKLLANIGTSGSKASGANAGIVVASPSKDNPNYFYFWLRDGSLVGDLISTTFL